MCLVREAYLVLHHVVLAGLLLHVTPRRTVYKGSLKHCMPAGAAIHLITQPASSSNIHTGRESNYIHHQYVVYCLGC